MSLKVAVIGAGSMGMNHIRVLREIGDERARLVGIADVSAAHLQHASGRFHVKGYSDYRQMIDYTSPDLVVVVVPTAMHYEVASYVLARGIHVLLEKPITDNVQEAQQLLAWAHHTGAKLAIGHIERFNPAIIEVKRRLMAGELGRIFHLNARRLGPFPNRISDVGVSLDLATHDVDIMRYLTDAEVQQVFAVMQQRVHQQCEDAVQGVLRFANNVVGTLEVNWLTPTKVRELSITGEKGMYVVNYLTQDVYFYQNDYTVTNWDALSSLKGVSEGTMTRLKVQKAEPLRLEYEDVLTAIEQDKSPTVSGEDGIAVLRIVHQLLASAQEGQHRKAWDEAALVVQG